MIPLRRRAGKGCQYATPQKGAVELLKTTEVSKLSDNRCAQHILPPVGILGDGRINPSSTLGERNSPRRHVG